MAFDEAEVARIFEELRAGARVTIGNWRYSTEYFVVDGALMARDFDEGLSNDRASSEAEVRRAIADNPEAFVPLARATFVRALSEAYARGDMAAARAHAAECARFGDNLGTFVLWDVAISPAEAPPPPAEVIAKVRAELDQFTAYHAFMNGTGWDKSPENGQRGAQFIETLMARVGEAPRGFEVISVFWEQAGDSAAAIAAQERAVALAPADAYWREGAEKRLAQLRAGAAAHRSPTS